MVELIVPLLYMFFAYAKIAESLWKRSKNETIHKAVAKAKMKSSRLMVAAFVVLVFCRPPILVLQLLEVYRVFDNRSFKKTILNFYLVRNGADIQLFSKPCHLHIPEP